MPRNKQTLVLLTAEFPYGKGEPFIEAEIKYLADSFGRVIVIPEKKEGVPRPVPQNVVVFEGPESMPKSVKLFFRALFSRDLWRELSVAKKVLRLPLSWRIFKIALKTLLDSLFWAEWIGRAFPENDGQRYIFYTYWCDAKTLALTWLRKKRKQDRFLTRLHGWDVYQERHNPAYLPFRRKMAEGLDAMIFISENGRKYVEQKWKLKNNESLKLSRLGTRQPLPFHGETKLYLVSCSGLIPLKRVGLIMDAVISLKGQVSWTHLGGGPLMSDLQKKINEAGASSYIKLLGNMTNDEVHHWYANNPGGFFINASESEGLPVSVMEAMSYAFPVIATNVGGTGEIVNGDNGDLLGPNPTVSEIADKVQEFYLLPEEERKSKSKQAYITWQEKFNADKNYRDFCDVISRL